MTQSQQNPDDTQPPLDFDDDELEPVDFDDKGQSLVDLDDFPESESGDEAEQF